MGLISKMIQLGSATPTAREVTARSSELAGELVSRIDTARKTTVGLGMLIVSDYGKLTAADQHISTDWASRPICTT